MKKFLNRDYYDGLKTGWRFGSEEAKAGKPYINEPKPNKKTPPFYRGYHEGYDEGYKSEKEKW